MPDADTRPKIPWSMESELRNLAQSEDLSQVFRDIGIISSHAKFKSLRQTSDWYRASEELYVYEFEVVDEEGNVIPLVAKAMVAPTLAVRPEQQLLNWLARKAELSRIGIRVPKHYLADKGVIVEQAVTQSLLQIVQEDGKRQSRLLQLVMIGEILGANGYAPRAIAPHIRVHSDQLYWTYFGTELDGPNSCNTREYCFNLIKAECLDFALCNADEWGSLSEKVNRDNSTRQ